MNIELNADGPHSGDSVRQAAAAMSEAARYLNRATIGTAGGLETASDAGDVLSYVHAAVASLPQLTRQLGAFLTGLEAAGRLGDDAGENPRARLAEAMFALGTTHGLARQLADALAKAHQATSHMRTED